MVDILELGLYNRFCNQVRSKRSKKRKLAIMKKQVNIGTLLVWFGVLSALFWNFPLGIILIVVGILFF